MSKKVQFVRKDGVTLAPVKDLFLFKDNPRDVEAKDFERLLEQIKLGEHSTMLVTLEGEVLGGNTRLRAYKKIGKEFAKVVVVEIVETKEGVHIIVDGVKSERVFDTVGQAKVELALSHNDSIGTNNTEKLAELMTINKVDTSIYSVATQITPVQDILDRVSPTGKDGENESEYDKDLADRNIYEPNDKDVAPSELYAESRKDLKALIDGIENTEVRDMLVLRYSFFVDFKMAKIADYYCNNATPEEQAVFEALGLVILDHDKAIENGFLEYVDKVEAIPDEEESTEE